MTYLPSGCWSSISQLSVSLSAVLQSTRHKAANGIFQSRSSHLPGVRQGDRALVPDPLAGEDRDPDVRLLAVGDVGTRRSPAVPCRTA